MRETNSVSMSGRRAQAARNDQRVLEAARAVFTADPEAPIAAVAERAGVGISALYRRYRSKEELLQRLSTESLERYVAEAEAALADEGDCWPAFSAFMRRCVDAGTGALSVRLAGRFAPTDELQRLGTAAYDATRRLLERARSAGAIRPDIEVADISLLLEQLQAVRVGDDERAGQLRRRYLAVLLEGLRHPASESLPGPPPTVEEVRRRY